MPLRGEYAPTWRDGVRKQIEEYERSSGTRATTLRGYPVVVLTTVGARSGKLRKTALMRVEHEGIYAVIASLGGQPKHPEWYFNVVAQPHVELQDGPLKQDMLGREAEGEERSLWWRRAAEAFPDYAEYQQRTTRRIPVLVLEPAR